MQIFEKYSVGNFDNINIDWSLRLDWKEVDCLTTCMECYVERDVSQTRCFFIQSLGDVGRSNIEVFLR